MDTPIVVDEQGKKTFVGVDEVVPVSKRSPNMRICPRCHREHANDASSCQGCGSQFDDGKMECPVCHKWFDYLVGENGNGGVMGCELCWKPPKGKGGA